MNYISTRGNAPESGAAEVIAQGMVQRGGLFVPESIPQLDLELLKNLNYHQLAFQVLSPYLCGEGKAYTEEELKDSIAAAYSAERFESDNPAPVKVLPDGPSVLELWHGPTAAFKDMALQILPHLLSGAVKKLGRKKEVVILVATSGDTGKAALEGFRDVPGTRVLVFYPKDGVSKVQELQMLTTSGSNTGVMGVDGNFDDCQTMVKNCFGDLFWNKKLSEGGFELSSANSINWGRLAPQIVYYFWGYFEMLRAGRIRLGDPIVAVVPTGNFGNILAAYYAREMGLPVTRLVCASNKNKVLSDFIATGEYDRRRDFHKTSSPSMDILISSNLERFLFEMTRHNAGKLSRWYDDLGRKGHFHVDDTTRQRIQSILSGGFATEEETMAEIKRVYDATGYVMDPHTAVGSHVYECYRKSSGDETPALLCSTASPFKFNPAVYSAITGQPAGDDELATAAKLSGAAKIEIHRALKDIDKLPARAKTSIKAADGKLAVERWLKLPETVMKGK